MNTYNTDTQILRAIRKIIKMSPILLEGYKAKKYKPEKGEVKIQVFVPYAFSKTEYELLAPVLEKTHWFIRSSENDIHLFVWPKSNENYYG